MFNDTNRDELIEQYLLNNLSEELRYEFNQRLAKDDQLKKDVHLQKAIIQNIRVVGREEWAQKLKDFHKEMELSNVEERKVNRTKLPIKFYEKKYVIGIAAMVIFIISTIAIIKKNSINSDHIFTAYYKPYDNLQSTSRALEGATGTERDEALKSYENGNYQFSIRQFKNILVKEEDEVVLFYLGNAYLSDNNAKEAESTFKNYLNKYKEFALESKWYLSLSYLKQKKIREAKPLLEELVKQNNKYSKEANEILHQL